MPFNGFLFEWLKRYTKEQKWKLETVKPARLRTVYYISYYISSVIIYKYKELQQEIRLHNNFKQFLTSYLLQYNVKKLIIVEKSSHNDIVGIVAKILRE